MSRIIFYIDGYNLYRGMLDQKWRKYLWLDLTKFCESLTHTHQTCELVRYHTSLITNKESKQRQLKFLEANKLNRKFKYVLGKFQPTPQDMYQEKKTDVNIAVNMIRDVTKRNCESIGLISADSDLVPALEYLKEIDKKIKIYTFFPPKRYSYDIKRQSSSKPIRLEDNEQLFIGSQLSETIRLKSGYEIKKPISW